MCNNSKDYIRTMMKILTLFSIFSIVGCGNIIAPPFEEPKVGPISKIRLYQVSGIQTTLSTFAERKNCTGALEIFRKVEEPTNYKTIPANKEFAFMATTFPSINTYCQLAGAFTPKEGAFYNMRVQYAPDVCLISIFRYLTEAGGKEINVPFTKLEYTIPFDMSGSFCKEPTQSQ